MPSFIRPNTANGIQRMFFRRLGRGISSCARTAQSRNSLSIPSTLLTVLGLLAMRRVVSPIIDRVSTFVHRLYGRYPYRAVLAPMALDFPVNPHLRCAPSVKGVILPAMTSYLSITTLPIYVASKKRGISFPMPLQLLSECRPVNTVTKAGRGEPASRTPRSPPTGTDKPHPR